jgi:radical SAM protein with 4Fe4S-binding SPASM domain
MAKKYQITLSKKLKRLRFHLGRGRGHLLAFIRNRILWHWYPRLDFLPDFPDHVDVELSSACDLSCPMCYTITEQFKRTVNRKLMAPELFYKIIDECAQHRVYSIRLSLRGEPFLHPDIIEFTRYAKRKGIREVSTLTNGVRLNPEKFEALLHAGLDWLTISFDGLGEQYEAIRKPAKFEESLEKIKTYAAIKRRLSSAKPVIKVQTIWPAIAQDPKAYYDTFEPIVDLVATNPLIDYKRNDREIVYVKNFRCPVLWRRLVIGADGQVLLCSNDEMGHNIVGDVNHQTLKEVWLGPEMTKAREIHRRHQGVELLAACKECHYPRATKTDIYRLDESFTVEMENYINRPQEIGR